MKSLEFQSSTWEEWWTGIRSSRPGSSRSSVDMEGPQNGHTAHELPRVCQLLPGVYKRICGIGVSDVEADAQQREKVRMER